MAIKVFRLICLVILCVAFAPVHSVNNGPIPMGVQKNCDNAKDGVEIDWDGKDDKPYTCKSDDRIDTENNNAPPLEIHEKRTKAPTHYCVQSKISYGNSIPLSGAHRPVWPTFGEYVYIPPQRWLHALEHGAVLFAYHPCTDYGDVRKFIRVVRNCIRKQIITPSDMLTKDRPFALISWGHGMFMDHFDEPEVRRWLKAHGIVDGPESRVYSDGQYTLGLKRKAKLIRDGLDRHICEDYEFRNGLN